MPLSIHVKSRTRVPVDSLIDYPEAGDTLDEFLNNFPSVNRDAAIVVLEEARPLLPAHDKDSH